jgi:hypothetical protein
MKFPMRSIPLRTSLVALAIITLSSAASAQNRSHAHIGHVGDAWRDTPDGAGFLPTARAEADIAATHAGLAVSGEGNLANIKRHIAHVMHAINAESMESGPGKGYGVLAAANGIATHIQLAGEAEGASDNVKRHSNHVATSAANVVAWSESIIERGQALQEATDAAAALEMAKEIQMMVNSIVSGHDANGDGNVGWGEGEGGLAQADQHLTLMKQGEGLTR